MEVKPIEAKVDEAIKALAGRAEEAVDGLSAMQYGQAALNLAQAASVRNETKIQIKLNAGKLVPKI